MEKILWGNWGLAGIAAFTLAPSAIAIETSNGNIAVSEWPDF
jgi:hypothetical protein